MISVLKKKLNNKKGFTLAELLIVVSIIAILVAVAIPVFTNALDQAKVQTDAANLRAAAAVARVEYMLVQAGEATASISDGMVFDNQAGKFVAAANKQDYMKGKASDNESKYIVVTVTTGSEPTVAWATVS